MCDLYSCVLVIAPIRVFYLLSLSWVRFWPGQTVWRWTSLFRRCSEACSSTPDATWDEKHTHLFNTVNCPNSCQQILAADGLLKIRRQQFNSKDANLSLERFFWDIFPGTICCQYVFWVIVQGVISCAYVTTLIQHNMRIFFYSCSDGAWAVMYIFGNSAALFRNLCGHASVFTLQATLCGQSFPNPRGGWILLSRVTTSRCFILPLKTSIDVEF